MNVSLFARICEGVQHAQREAIIHRDLKPSNILVAEVDGRRPSRISTRELTLFTGVIFYEMVAGELPCDYRKLAFDEVMRKIPEEESAAPRHENTCVG